LASIVPHFEYCAVRVTDVRMGADVIDLVSGYVRIRVNCAMTSDDGTVITRL